MFVGLVFLRHISVVLLSLRPDRQGSNVVCFIERFCILHLMIFGAVGYRLA